MASISKERQLRQFLSRVLGVGTLITLTLGQIEWLTNDWLARLRGVSYGYMATLFNIPSVGFAIAEAVAQLAALSLGLLAPQLWRRKDHAAVAIAITAVATGIPLLVLNYYEPAAVVCSHAVSLVSTQLVWFASGFLLIWRGKLPATIETRRWASITVAALLGLLGLFAWSVWILVFFVWPELNRLHQPVM